MSKNKQEKRIDDLENEMLFLRKIYFKLRDKVDGRGLKIFTSGVILLFLILAIGVSTSSRIGVLEDSVPKEVCYEKKITEKVELELGVKYLRSLKDNEIVCEEGIMVSGDQIWRIDRDGHVNKICLITKTKKVCEIK